MKPSGAVTCTARKGVDDKSYTNPLRTLKNALQPTLSTTGKIADEKLKPTRRKPLSVRTPWLLGLLRIPRDARILPRAPDKCTQATCRAHTKRGKWDRDKNRAGVRGPVRRTACASPSGTRQTTARKLFTRSTNKHDRSLVHPHFMLHSNNWKLLETSHTYPPRRSSARSPQYKRKKWWRTPWRRGQRATLLTSPLSVWETWPDMLAPSAHWWSERLLKPSSALPVAQMLPSLLKFGAAFLHRSGHPSLRRHSSVAANLRALARSDFDAGRGRRMTVTWLVRHQRTFPLKPLLDMPGDGASVQGEKGSRR